MAPASSKKITRAPPLFYFLHFWLRNERELSEQPEWLNVWPLPSEHVESNWEPFLIDYPIPDPETTALDSWKSFCHTVHSKPNPLTSYQTMLENEHADKTYKWLKKKTDRKKIMKRIDQTIESGLRAHDNDVISLMKLYCGGKPLSQCDMPGQDEFYVVQANALRLVLGTLASAPGAYGVPERSTKGLWSAWLAGYLERAKKGRRRAAELCRKKLEKVLAVLPLNFLDDPPELNATTTKALLTACEDYTRASGWVESEPGASDHQVLIAERVGFLEAIINARSATKITLPGPSSASRTRGAAAGSVYALFATDEEVEEIIAIVEAWHDRLGNQSNSAADVLDLPDIESGSVEWANIPDLGVEKYAGASEEELCQLLGYAEECRRPPTFAAYRNVDGLDGWLSPDVNISTTDPDTNCEISLLWHQLVAVASILEGVFTAAPIRIPKPTPQLTATARSTSNAKGKGKAEEEDAEQLDTGRFPGILLADEVGLGKTATCIAVMCMVADLASHSESHSGSREAALPPLLKNLPYFAGTESRDNNKPMLVVVPGALMHQWPKELRTFVRPHALDIFVFPNVDKLWDTFWAEYDKSKQPPCRRVIIAASSTLQRMGQKLDKNNSELPETVCAHTRNKPSLWCIDYSLVIVDEAHNYRTPTAAASRALNVILKYSHLCIAATATPLYTKPSDLFTIGRLLRLPSCRGPTALEFQHTTELDIARLRRSAFRDQDASDAWSSRFNGKSYPPALEGYRSAAMKFVTQIQKRFKDRIIRRSGNSLDAYGERIQKAIAPMVEINAHIDLTPREERKLRVLKDDLKEVRSVVEANITDSFFLNYRLGAAYPWRRSEYPASKYPPVESIEEWDSRKGSKINALAALVVHALMALDDEPRFPQLEEDDTLPVDFLEDIPIIDPDFPVVRKIVVYHEFAQMTALIASVLDLYGVKVWRYTGDMAKGRRETNLQAFKTSNKGGVLLMTNVGAEGINMTEADTLISFDMFWSMVQDRQLRGRVYRMGQTKEVYFVRIIANGTMDVRMGYGGNVKADMLARFYEKPTRGGGSSTDSEDEDSDSTRESEEEFVPKVNTPRRLPRRETNPEKAVPVTTPTSAAWLTDSESEPIRWGSQGLPDRASSFDATTLLPSRERSSSSTPLLPSRERSSSSSSTPPPSSPKLKRKRIRTAAQFVITSSDDEDSADPDSSTEAPPAKHFKFIRSGGTISVINWTPGRRRPRR